MKSKRMFLKPVIRDILVMMLFAFLLIIIPTISQAQVVPYSQYYNTPLLTNPAQAAESDYARIGVHYRRSRVANYETPSVAFVHPFFRRAHGLRAGGIGAHVIRQEAGPGGAFVVTGAMATFAYNIPVNKRHNISAGLQGGMTNKRLDVSRITTDNQFSFGAFDPSLSHGENFRSSSVTKPVINSGFTYTVSDTSHMPKAVIGVAFFNMNRPAYGFMPEAQREDLIYCITAEVLLVKRARASVHPSMRYISGATSFANIGAQMRYDLAGENEVIGVGAWYKTTKAIVGALQYNRDNYMLTASLDFSAAANLDANVNNALEIGMGWQFRKGK